MIPGEEESRLACLAVQAGLGVTEGSLVVFDTGGGSSQFIFGRGRCVEEHFSLAEGAPPYTERFDLAGACIVRTVMERRGQQTLTVSDRGLRHGLLVDRFGV